MNKVYVGDSIYLFSTDKYEFKTLKKKTFITKNLIETFDFEGDYANFKYCRILLIEKTDKIFK